MFAGPQSQQGLIGGLLGGQRGLECFNCRSIAGLFQLRGGRLHVPPNIGDVGQRLGVFHFFGQGIDLL